MNIRAISAADLSNLARLHAASFSEAWSERALQELLAMPGTFGFAAQNGFILARVADDEAEILTIAVTPEARRAGLGSALLAAAAHRASELGARTLFLEVGDANSAARALYDRFAFRTVGKRKAYYGVHGEDALILRAELPLPALGKLPASTRLDPKPRGIDRDAD